MFGGWEREPSFATGTAIDEFSWIYRALARETTLHGAFAPSEVDLWDITTVAVVLGVATDGGASGEFARWEQEFDDMIGQLVEEQKALSAQES